MKETVSLTSKSEGIHGDRDKQQHNMTMYYSRSKGSDIAGGSRNLDLGHSFNLCLWMEAGVPRTIKTGGQSLGNTRPPVHSLTRNF